MAWLWVYQNLFKVMTDKPTGSACTRIDSIELKHPKSGAAALARSG